MKTVRKGYFVAKDGARLYFEVVGKGRPVVFCYGLVCNMQSYRFQRAFLGRRYQCIFFDYRGHERSSGVPVSRRGFLSKTGRDVHALVNHLGIEKVSVVGHSFGVNVAHQFATFYPKRVSGLVWINGLLDNPLGTMFRHQYMQHLFLLLGQIYDTYPYVFNGGWRWVTGSTWLPYLIVAPLGFNMLLSQNHDIRNYVEGIAATSPRTFMEAMFQLTQTKGSKQLSKLKNIPTLVCAGEFDNVTPFELQKAQARRIPNSRFVKVPEGSHNAHLERPEFLNHCIDQFLKNL